MAETNITKTLKTKILLLNGNQSSWDHEDSNALILGKGEPAVAFSTDDSGNLHVALKIGDGNHNWKELPYVNDPSMFNEIVTDSELEDFKEAFIGNKATENTEGTVIYKYIDDLISDIKSEIGTADDATNKDTVYGYINKKTSGLATSGNIDTLSDKIDVLNSDYKTQGSVDYKIENHSYKIDDQTNISVKDLYSTINSQGQEIGQKLNEQEVSEKIAQFTYDPDGTGSNNFTVLDLNDKVQKLNDVTTVMDFRGVDSQLPDPDTNTFQNGDVVLVNSGDDQGTYVFSNGAWEPVGNLIDTSNLASANHTHKVSDISDLDSIEFILDGGTVDIE